MNDLLTTEEYKAIAAGLTFPTQAFIDGHFRPALSGKTFDTVNPATGAVLAKVAACDAADVDLAVAKARDAFEDGRWSRLHPKERKETLIRLAKLIKRNARELAVLESLDKAAKLFAGAQKGKPVGSVVVNINAPELHRVLAPKMPPVDAENATLWIAREIVIDGWSGHRCSELLEERLVGVHRATDPFALGDGRDRER